ncbi:DUF397 domain-containing protein [Streptomyces sp. NBC_01381]|uniref:DUF397 domain-containing protein n=1 Tax=Streptomyces sp. NBC_01381 TaxID=2903845 RepID=UPI00225C34EE|nr:DUF397 domain-containing protein [Streptomyces sp. NBC_01381]MCX4667970.1 DUF397 domain-containing protein [Streptomyces sp. NBC_01381]
MNAELTTRALDEQAWVKSSYSGAEGGQCIEVAVCSNGVYIRDSKDTARPSLSVSPRGWTTFIGFAAQD